MVPNAIVFWMRDFFGEDLARSFWVFGSNQVPPDFFSSDRSPVMNEEQSEAGTITFLDDLRWS